ncbi:MAG TPA: hypothetical protein VKX17_22950 [Planctomycetota bacterium]|nr:hypothetical protein [Planctomycetota bacterium]
MAIQAGQIYLSKHAALGKSKYARPCLVMRVDSVGAVVVYFSTKFDLIEPGNFPIYDTDEGFKETGLKESSYLVCNHGVPVKMHFFDGAKLLGNLTGELRRRVEEWWGEPFK